MSLQLLKKIGDIGVNANCHELHEASLGPVLRSKVFIISKITTKRYFLPFTQKETRCAADAVIHVRIQAEHEPQKNLRILSH